MATVFFTIDRFDSLSNLKQSNNQQPNNRDFFKLNICGENILIKNYKKQLSLL